MNENTSDPPPTLRERLMSHFIQTVPEESAICEFDCSKTECSDREWKQCKRRLDSLLDPGLGPFSPPP